MAMGAESTIDPLTEDVKTTAGELTDGAGVDLVYDVAGGDMSEPALRALRFDGRFLVIGFPGGIAKVPLNLVLLNNRTVIGVEWGGWVPRNMDENRAMIGDIVDAIARGELHPVKPTERPLTDAAGSALRAARASGRGQDRARAVSLSSSRRARRR